LSIIECVIQIREPAAEPDEHPAVASVEVPNGIQLAYADDRGRRRVVALEDAAEIDFGQSRPFQKLPAYRGQRNFPGWWWSATTRSHVAYKSWLGRHHLIEADRDARVLAIAGQPFELTWPRGKRQVRHVPDFLFQLLDGGAIVTDCRTAAGAGDDFRYKTAVTAAACSVIGWDFRVVGEPDPVWSANLRWLAGYRHPRFGDEQLEAVLLELFADARPLAEAAAKAGDPIRVRPVLFHLLWRGRLAGDLSRPLGETTILAACADPLDKP
jgi:hypothetical protein